MPIVVDVWWSKRCSASNSLFFSISNFQSSFQRVMFDIWKRKRTIWQWKSMEHRIHLILTLHPKSLELIHFINQGKLKRKLYLLKNEATKEEALSVKNEAAKLNVLVWLNLQWAQLKMLGTFCLSPKTWIRFSMD